MKCENILQGKWKFKSLLIKNSSQGGSEVNETGSRKSIEVNAQRKPIGKCLIKKSHNYVFRL